MTQENIKHGTPKTRCLKSLVLLLLTIMASTTSAFVFAEDTSHFPYNGICAPGFVPLDAICVLNDRCGPGAYPGKVCTMDGKTLPYLSPRQQGNAGISAKNVICAEGLELVFKASSGAPVCVKPESITKLEDRGGWQKSRPDLACTLEYAPVCGVNNITYGNACMLSADHIALKNKGECTANPEERGGVFPNTFDYTINAPEIDSDKGYFVEEIADGLYWLVGSGYQTMFLTTGKGVIAIDAPQPIGQKYIDAINEVTDESITHMIYSHYHQDHTGAAGQIFPQDITYISHQETADSIVQENGTERPIPNVTFDDNYTLTVGSQTLELYHIGNFHSSGDIVIYSPFHKIAMVVDLMRPGITPYRAFAVTPDIEQYINAHDTLVEDFDFDIMVSGHTGTLATKEHIKTNKQFTLDIMENAKNALQVQNSDPVQTCVDATIKQWSGRLEKLDEFMVEHCTAMINYLSE
jgi:glyoxylase-like metal-dependent hydrolase (beta-lactamase superfamily II)